MSDCDDQHSLLHTTAAQERPELRATAMTDIQGSWTITLHAPGTDAEMGLVLRGGDVPTGTLTAEGESGELLELTVDGSSASWRTRLTKPMPLMVDFQATSDADRIEGVATVNSFIKMPFDGHRA